MCGASGMPLEIERIWAKRDRGVSHDLGIYADSYDELLPLLAPKTRNRCVEKKVTKLNADNRVLQVSFCKIKGTVPTFSSAIKRSRRSLHFLLGDRLLHKSTLRMSSIFIMSFLYISMINSDVSILSSQMWLCSTPTNSRVAASLDTYMRRHFGRL